MNVILNPSVYQPVFALLENRTGEMLQSRLYNRPHPFGRPSLAKSAWAMRLGPPLALSEDAPGGRWLITELEQQFVDDQKVAISLADLWG